MATVTRAGRRTSRDFSAGEPGGLILPVAPGVERPPTNHEAGASRRPRTRDRFADQPPGFPAQLGRPPPCPWPWPLGECVAVAVVNGTWPQNAGVTVVQSIVATVTSR
jgi:hypothetical protein